MDAPNVWKCSCIMFLRQKGNQLKLLVVGKQNKLSTKITHYGNLVQHGRLKFSANSSLLKLQVILWKESDRGQWSKFYTHEVHASSVNSIQWAPPDTGLYLACGSSDGTISILQGSGDDKFSFLMIQNAHTVSQFLL